MSIQDYIYILQWWFPIFLLGLIFFPITSVIFESFFDKGYIFSRVIALGTISYLSLVVSDLHVLKFNPFSILSIVTILLIVNILIWNKKRGFKLNSQIIYAVIFEELLFICGIVLWSFVRGHEPSINGLEKFMDFGFLNSILRSDYMPPTDMWFPPFPINYYYFGHLSTAVLTKISFLPSFITFNLMIATLFSFAFSLTFSLGANLIKNVTSLKKGIFGGIISAVFLTFAGNLHMIYGLFKAYDVNNPVPFWNLPFLPLSFPNGYWYPNATRFIPYTIHEFPIYSFVVSDLHGHVLDIMYVLLSIALIYTLFLKKGVDKITLVVVTFFLSIMYMTNAWDGGIYLLLVALIIGFKNFKFLKIKSDHKFTKIINNLMVVNVKSFLFNFLKSFLIIFVLFFLFSLPFSSHFDSGEIVHGIGVVCAPGFLTNIGHIGPFLFEANHCQHSTWWELLTLYGFFYFFVVSFIIFILRFKKLKLLPEDIFILALIFLSTVLIIVPEFVYLKDIYPAHYRANTMFKLVYQAFMMLSIVSSYVLVRILSKTRNFIFYILSCLFIIPVLIYPYFAIKSYYGDLKTYTGIDGTQYLKTRYPDDYAAINWINTNIKGRPVMVEAQGDSYTDYERISSNTGLPTILGWTVHEWLWRGSYEVPAPRIQEVKDIYESRDLNLTKKILKKYNAQYIYVGGLEYQKYNNINSEKFLKLGKIVYKIGQTTIYKLSI